jgi:hypothetical protein
MVDFPASFLTRPFQRVDVDSISCTQILLFSNDVDFSRVDSRFYWFGLYFLQSQSHHWHIYIFSSCPQLLNFPVNNPWLGEFLRARISLRLDKPAKVSEGGQRINVSHLSDREIHDK